MGRVNTPKALWRKLKKEWLKPGDYLEKDNLFYAANRCLAKARKQLNINFSPFRLNYFQ